MTKSGDSATSMPPNGRWKSALAALAALAALNAAIAAPVSVLEANAPARHWRQSSLTGNGTIGAMVQGGVADEIIHLSHYRIYMPMDSELDKGSRDPFMAACNLRISTDIQSWTGYVRRTALRTGECFVEATDGDGRSYRRRVFASRPDNVIAIKIEDEAAREPFLTFGAPPMAGCREARIFEGGIRRVEVGKRDGCLFYRCEFSNRNAKNELSGYVVALAAGDGKKEAFVAIEPVSKDALAPDPFPAMRKRLAAAVATGYDALLARHAPVMDVLFSGVTLDIDCDDPGVARRYASGRYNAISSSGGSDADSKPSSGFWTATWGDPWGNVDPSFELKESVDYVRLVEEALVRGEEDSVTFLPAKPAGWRSGKLKGILLRGAVRLDELSWERDDWRASLRFRDGTLLTLSREDVPGGIYYYKDKKSDAVQSDD